MQSKKMEIDVEGVGRVSFERSRRARTLNITVRPRSNVRVAVPRGIPISRAMDFARSKSEWLKARLQEFGQLEQDHRQLLEKEARLDKKEARDLLIKRLAELAHRNGFAYNRVSVRRQKTRWGSCSADNNISLNMRTVLLPGRLRDYVILHELVHTKIKHHGMAFWQALDRMVGDAKNIDRQLRPYRVLLR